MFVVFRNYLGSLCFNHSRLNQNKKLGNKETLCSHTVWVLKTNIPPHQIYINWSWNWETYMWLECSTTSTIVATQLKRWICWEQKSQGIQLSWSYKLTESWIIGVACWVCVHWNFMSHSIECCPSSPNDQTWQSKTEDPYKSRFQRHTDTNISHLFTHFYTTGSL